MKKKYRLLVGATALATAGLFFGASQAFAIHPDVTLKGYDGGSVGVNDPYSPKNTCAGCHFECSSGDTTADQSTWCDGTLGLEQKDCTVDPCPDYAEGVKTSVHTQGVRDGAGDDIFWQSSTTTSPEHGASVGQHVMQGRNEDYDASVRAAFSDDFFASTPGMFGKY